MSFGKPEQLTLPLPHHAAMGADDFLATASNAAALAWVQRWPDWPGHILLIHGPAGSGKTHLGKVWQEISGARCLTALHTKQAILSDDRLMIDDVPTLLRSPADETRLFHIINQIREQNAHLLLTAAQPPSRWPLTLPDLKSRLMAVPMAELYSPDDHLLAGLLIKQFHDRQVQVSADVIEFLLPRIERQASAIAALVQALDQSALKLNKAITIPLVKQVLGA